MPEPVTLVIAPRLTEAFFMNLRTMARVFGAVFLVVGILGFIPGITQMHTDVQAKAEGLTIGGPGHGMLLGIFHVNVLHNLVHLAFGILGLLAAGSVDRSRMYF